MGASKSVRLRNRREMEARRLANIRRKLRRERRAIAAYCCGRVPLAVEIVPGLWWVESREGHFVEAKDGGQAAFDPKAKAIIHLAPIAVDAAADAIFRHAEWQEMWSQRYQYEVPF